MKWLRHCENGGIACWSQRQIDKATFVLTKRGLKPLASLDPNMIRNGLYGPYLFHTFSDDWLSIFS